MATVGHVAHPGDPSVGTLVFVAPRAVGSGVGDHADALLEALRPHAQDVVELRCGGAGEDSLLDCLRLRRRVDRELRARPAGTVVLHAELSGGSVAPFWALAFRRGVVRTALVHEPPRPVWTIFRFRLVARSRLVDNAIHRALDPVVVAIERAGVRGVGLVGTTTRGSAGLAARGFGREARSGRLMPSAGGAVPPASSRPRAVGLFGYHYRGKGFDLLEELRRRLDPDIGIVVAGRGTESLPSRPGVRVLGAVDGEQERQFFAGVRLVLLPYRRKTVRGVRMDPASGTFNDASAYRTPCIALASAGLDALTGSGCDTVPDLPALVHRVEELVADDAALARLADELAAFRSRQSVERSAEPVLAQWTPR
jgi:hypothetical protein